MIIKRVLLLLSILMIFGCKEQDKSKNQSKYPSNIGHLLKSINPELKDNQIEEIEFLVVIPNAGCDECINEAERLLFDFKDKNGNLYFLLTTFDIEKSIYLKYGYEIKSNERVLIDKQNIFLGNGFNSIYPIVIYLDAGNLKKIEYQNPENPNTISNVRRLLNSNQISENSEIN